MVCTSPGWPIREGPSSKGMGVAESAEANLRVIQHQLEQHMSVSLDIVCVACQHLLMGRQVRLELLPYQVIALLLLEVHCRAQEPSAMVLYCQRHW